MPDYSGNVGQIDSANKSDEWKRLGDVAEKLKRKIERAISADNGEIAESYHNRLLGVEYLMRQEADK